MTTEFRGPVRALTSFWFFRQYDMDDVVEQLTEDGNRPTLIADSGAFSAYTNGATVTPQGYADWLARWPGVFDWAITMDIINDPEASWASHQATEQACQRRLVPVVHYGEPLSEFDRYRDAGHSLMAVGGLAMRDMYSQGKRFRWLNGVFDWAKVNGVALHGLGIGSFKQMYELPWWSVDASSWTSGHHYGLTAIFDPQLGKMKRVSRQHAQAHDERQARILRSRGVEPRWLARDFQRRWAGSVGADSYRRAEHWIRQRAGVVPCPNDPALTPLRDQGEGIRVHLASVYGDLGMLVGDAPLSQGGTQRWVPTS